MGGEVAYALNLQTWPHFLFCFGVVLCSSIMSQPKSDLLFMVRVQASCSQKMTIQSLKGKRQTATRTQWFTAMRFCLRAKWTTGLLPWLMFIDSAAQCQLDGCFLIAGDNCTGGGWFSSQQAGSTYSPPLTGSGSGSFAFLFAPNVYLLFLINHHLRRRK